MKSLLSEVLTVDGFGDIHVEIVEWHKEKAPCDSALIGISLKGESVSSETNFKSIQGFCISDYSQFQPRQYAKDFILSGVHTTPLLSSPTVLTNTNIDTSGFVSHEKEYPIQMAFHF